MEKLDQGDLYERADAIAKKMPEKEYNDVFEPALVRLVRCKPIVDVLQKHDIPPFIGPIKQRGFHVIIREENPRFVAHIEETAGKSLDTGTILYPKGFSEHVDQLKAVTQYQEVLAIHKIKSEIIHVPNPGTEERMVVLYVPLFRS